jgi:hypothetical protein
MCHQDHLATNINYHGIKVLTFYNNYIIMVFIMQIEI